MDREEMRTVLFWLFVVIVATTTVLTAYGTIAAISAQNSEELWSFVRFSWPPVLLEVVAFIVVLAKNLFGLRSFDLAREVAARLAQDLVTNSGSNRNALDTAYWEAKRDFGLHFSSQGETWLQELEKAFETQVTRESRRYPSLKNWKPSDTPLDLEPIALAS